ncbi:tryptophan-rich sensory protein [soil metagenome]
MSELNVPTKPQGNPKRWIALGLFLIASYAAGFVGSYATNQGLQFWYQTLTKPSFNPPNWLFAPVWTILYALMGVAAWQVWERRDGPRGAALAVFFVQLVLNAAWSWVFFAGHQLKGALWVIGALWVSIATMIVLFSKVRKSAGAMLVPYLLWLSFAALLNYAIFRLNPVVSILPPIQ